MVETVPRALRYVTRHHGCCPVLWRRELMENDTGIRDLVYWPVHTYGMGVDDGVPFTAHAKCPACDEWLERDFDWGSWRELAFRNTAEEALHGD